MSMMIVDPYRFAAGPIGDAVFAVQDFTSGTATGVQTFTSSTITGLTPKAVLLLNGLHDPTNDPNETPGLSFGVGMVNAANDFRVYCFSGDNRATTLAASGWAADQAVQVDTNAGVTQKRAIGQTASGGVQLNYTTNNSPSLRGAFAAFAGGDVQGATGSQNLGTGTSAIDITSPGFEPDVVIIGTPGSTGGVTTPMHFSFGICVNDGLDTQRGIFWSEGNSLADSRPFQQLRNDRIGGKISSTTGGVSYGLTVGSFDASGFSVTPSASAGTEVMVFTAINFGGRQFKLVDFTTPTSTGNSTITGAGFTPSFAIVALTNLETLNNDPASTTSDLQSGIGISFIGDEQWAMSGRINAGEATTDTATQISNAAIMGASATDCDAILASFVAWTSDGVTVNYSAVQGTGKKGFVLFVE